MAADLRTAGINWQGRSMRIPVAPDVSLVADAYGDAADPPVVLLHGGGQTRHSWDNSARIARRIGLVRTDRRPAWSRRQRLVARR